MYFTKLQKQAAGLDATDLCEYQQVNDLFLLHKEIVEPFTCLRQQAKKAGFDLAIVSAYRDYARQLAIWNAKACGKRQLLDTMGRVLNCEQLNDREKLAAILRWSAIPGTSRHHWGSDIDIYDASRIDRQQVRLIPEEVEKGGICADMHEWLTERIANNESYGFFRPYNRDSGGVAPEMWHLSYWPVSKQYMTQLTPDLMLKLWQESELMLLDELKTNITDIWSQFVDLQYNEQPFWVTPA